MDNITFNIKPSQKSYEIAEKVIQSDNQKVVENGIKSLVSGISNYDDYVLAGRIKIHELVMSISSIDIYLITNEHMFNDEFKNYLYDNIVFFNKLIKDNEMYNYLHHDYFSATMLEKMYLLKSVSSKKPTETPVLHHLRIAVHKYYDETLESVVKCFNELNNSYYSPPTPMRLHAGLKQPQSASCFLMGIDDNLESMMYTGWGDMGMISRYGGGIGVSLNKIRHSDIAGTGNSAGVMPYARVCDKAIGYVDQSRTRRGAATAYLNVWHIDIEDFIQSPSNTLGEDVKVTSLTPCIWMHDLFFERCRKNETWTLFCPNKAKSLCDLYGEDFEHEYMRLEALAPAREQEFIEADMEYDKVRKQFFGVNVPTESMRNDFINAERKLYKASKERIVHKSVMARNIMKLIADTQLKSGKPYIMNGDRCNAKSNQQNIGAINNSNLCVEIVQYSDSKTFSSCNLTSINLPIFAKDKFTKDDKSMTDEEIMEELTKLYDFEELGNITRSVVDNLNKIIDHNFYPFDPSKIKNFNLDTRPLGIGVSGLDDCFKVIDLVYDSRVSFILNKMIFACMYFNALVRSNELVEKYGEYKYFRTGSFKIYDPVNQETVTMNGSPLSNGFFQFDLWDREYYYDLSKGRVNDNVYDPSDNVPIDPKYFGSKFGWSELRTKIVDKGIVNSLLIALMPTASTAQLLRNSESVEAHQRNLYSRQLAIGSFRIINRHMYKDFDEIGLLDKDFIDYLYNNAGKIDGYANYYLNKINNFKKGLTIYKQIINEMKSNKDSLIPSLMIDNDKSIANIFDIVNNMSSDNIPSELEISKSFDNKVSVIYNRLCYLEEKYKTMFDIPYQNYIKMARQRGIYVDQSQSMNIYFVDPTIKELAEIQMCGYDNKVKTHIYYLRNEIASSKTGFNKSVKSIISSLNNSKEDTKESTPTKKLTIENNVQSCSINNPDCISCSL